MVSAKEPPASTTATSPRRVRVRVTQLASPKPLARAHPGITVGSSRDLLGDPTGGNPGIIPGSGIYRFGQGRSIARVVSGIPQTRGIGLGREGKLKPPIEAKPCVDK